MKKLLTLSIALFLTANLFGQSLCSEFKNKFGKNVDFTEINITPQLFQLLGGLADDDESKNMIEKFETFNLLASEKPSPELLKNAENFLSPRKYEEMMSVKEEGSVVKIYFKGNKERITDLVIMVCDSSDFALIEITGIMKMDDIKKLTGPLNISSLSKVATL